MNLATLFGKLHEHKIELNRLAKRKEGDNKKNISLKTTDVKDMVSEDENYQSKIDIDMYLLFR